MALYIQDEMIRNDNYDGISFAELKRLYLINELRIGFCLQRIAELQEELEKR